MKVGDRSRISASEPSGSAGWGGVCIGKVAQGRVNRHGCTAEGACMHNRAGQGRTRRGEWGR